MIDLEAAKDFQYVGTFWTPDNPDRKFSGTLYYSQNEGVSVKIIGTIETFRDFTPSAYSETITLHGNLENMGKVTLINCLSAGGTSKLGQEESHFIKNYTVLYTVIGLHFLKDNALFNGISFHFEELNNFIVPFPEEYFIADNTPQIDCCTEDGLKISIKQGKKDSIYLPNILYSYGIQHSQKHLEQLRKETKDIWLSKPFYFFHISGGNKTLGDYIKIRHKIEKLFSIFFLKPIISTYTLLNIKEVSCQIIETRIDHKNNSKIPYMPHLPLCINNIKQCFPEILRKFDDILEYSLVDTYLTDKHYNNIKSGMQQYSVIVALIGAWQTKQNGDYQHRYEDFFTENLQPSDKLNDGLIEKMKKILGQNKTLSELALDIGEIRNTILHIDNIPNTKSKIKKYGNIINSDTDISNLCEILYIIIIKAIYAKLGIQLQDQQKENLLRYCLTWNSISL